MREEDAKSWNVMTGDCVRVSGGAGVSSKGLLLRCVVYVHVHAHVINSAFTVCVGRQNPSSRFLPPASSCFPPPPYHHAYNSQRRRRTRGHRGEEPVFLSVFLCPHKLWLLPPLTECYYKSVSSRRHIFPYLSIHCVLELFVWLGRSEPCVSARQCGNVSVKSFGSFLNTALPKDPLGNVVLTPPLFSPHVSLLSPFHNYTAFVSPCSSLCFF